MRIKLCKKWGKHKKGTELVVTNDLAKELADGGYTQNKTPKTKSKKEKFVSNESRSN